MKKSSRKLKIKKYNPGTSGVQATNDSIVDKLGGKDAVTAGAIQGGVAAASIGGTLLENAATKGKAYGQQDTTKATAGSALKYGAMGAQMGSVAGPWGAAIGAGVGVIGGGIAGYLGAEKANSASKWLRRDEMNKEFNSGITTDVTANQKTQIMRDGGTVKAKGKVKITPKNPVAESTGVNKPKFVNKRGVALDGIKDKSSREYLEKTGIVLPNAKPKSFEDYYNAKVVKQYKDSGSPTVTPMGNGLVDKVMGRANFNMITNNMNIDGSADDYTAELTHAKQRKDYSAPKIMSMGLKNAGAYVTGKDPYKTKGTIENDAHYNLEDKIWSDYKGMYGKAMEEYYYTNNETLKKAAAKSPKKANGSAGTGTTVIEIEGKKTPEIHTDKNFNVKNLGTTPHSKGGDKVLANDGDIVFPTQDSPEKYSKIMNAIQVGDVATLKKEQSKLPEDKPMKKKAKKYRLGVDEIDGPGTPGYIDKTLVPNLVKNGGIGNTTVELDGKQYGGLGTTTDQRKNYTTDYVKDTWAAYSKGDLQVLNDKSYPTPYVRGVGADGKPGTGAAIAVNGYQPIAPLEGRTNITNSAATPLSAPTTVPVPGKTTVPASPAKKTGDFPNIGKYAGIVNNLAQGFKKPEVEKATYFRPDYLKYEDRSEPLRKQSRAKMNMDTQTGRNLSGGNIANYRSNAQGASIDNYGRQESIHNREMERSDAIDIQNVGIKNEANKYNHSVDLAVNEANAKNRAVPGMYRDAAINDLVKVSQVNEQMKNQKKYSEDYLSLLGEMGYNYGFESLDNLKANWQGDKGQSIPTPINTTTTSTKEKVGNTTTTTTTKPNSALGNSLRRVSSGIRNSFRRNK